MLDESIEMVQYEGITTSISERPHFFHSCWMLNPYAQVGNISLSSEFSSVSPVLTALSFPGPLNNTIVDLNKSKIIKNGGELTDLDYLPSKQKMWNISRTQTHEPLISSGPSIYTRTHCKRALNDGEWQRNEKDQVPQGANGFCCQVKRW